jgi:hypothetical protein
VGVPHAAYLLTCWSASPKQIWSQHLATWESSWLLSVMWHEEALCGLGVQGVGFFASSFYQVWLQCISRFLIYRSLSVCFLPLIAILDPLKIFLDWLYFLGFCLFGWFWSHIRGEITNRLGGNQYQLDPFGQI